MRVLIIGAGAIGSFVGGKLALAGHQVTLVGRPAYAEAVRKRGLRLTEEGKTSLVRQATVATSLADAFANRQDYDLACLTVKSYDTDAAADELAAATSAPPPLLTFQNGVGNEEKLAERFRPARVLSGTITSPVEVQEPGAVTVARAGSIGLAPVQPGGSLAGADAALREAGFRVTLYDNFRSLKWSKLLMNMMSNASCAILDWPPTQVFADQQLCALERLAFREGLAVMQAQSIPLVRVGSYPMPLIAPVLSRLPVALLQPLLQRTVGGARGGKMPSLHMDLSRGKGRSEVEVLNGAIARAGAQFGVRVPVNWTLHRLLLGLTRGELAWDDFRGRPERLLAEAGLV